MAEFGFFNAFGRNVDVFVSMGTTVGAVGSAAMFIHWEVSRMEKKARDDVIRHQEKLRQDAKNARAEVNLAREKFRNGRIQSEARTQRERIYTEARVEKKRIDSEARAERELTKAIANLKEAMVEASGARKVLKS